MSHPVQTNYTMPAGLTSLTQLTPAQYADFVSLDPWAQGETPLQAQDYINAYPLLFEGLTNDQIMAASTAQDVAYDTAYNQTPAGQANQAAQSQLQSEQAQNLAQYYAAMAADYPNAVSTPGGQMVGVGGPPGTDSPELITLLNQDQADAQRAAGLPVWFPQFLTGNAPVSAPPAPTPSPSPGTDTPQQAAGFPESFTQFLNGNAVVTTPPAPTPSPSPAPVTSPTDTATVTNPGAGAASQLPAGIEGPMPNAGATSQLPAGTEGPTPTVNPASVLPATSTTTTNPSTTTPPTTTPSTDSNQTLQQLLSTLGLNYVPGAPNVQTMGQSSPQMNWADIFA